MKKPNTEFFEEFKKLEKILNDMYDDNHGLKLYIDELKVHDGKTWGKELKQLVHLRHIRNHLAHDEGAFEEKCVTNDDILWLQNFCNKILRGKDPLNSESYKRDDNGLKSVISWLIIIAAIVLSIIIIFNVVNK